MSEKNHVTRNASRSARWLCLVLLPFAVLACTTSGSKDPGTGTPTGSEFKDAPQPPEPPRSSADAAAMLQPVYFDFDRSEIRSDAKPVLRANAKAIQDNEGWGRIRVEGHTDERGSEEYNLALGQRRANSVRQYLIDLGVPGGRVETVSFGEAKPAVNGHSESAWRYNRRSEFSLAR